MAIRRFDITPLLPLLDAGYALLTPNNRSVDGILREYASSIRDTEGPDSAWKRPAVFAIDIYIQQLWQVAASQGIAPFCSTQLLSRFDEQEIWLQIVKSSYTEYPLLNSEETASSASRSYQFFKQWDVASSAAIGHYKNAIDFQTFLSWSDMFEARCRKIEAASLSDAGRLITTHIDRLKPLLPEKIALVSFNQPPPLYTKLFVALAAVCEFDWRQEANQYWQLDSIFENSRSSKLNYQNGGEEIAACLRWCQQKVEEFPAAHVGIVVDHSRSLEPLIEEALFKTSENSNAKKFEFATHMNRYHSSEKLNELPEFNNALSILALNNDLVNSERFCKLLQSPFTIGAEQEYSPRIAFEIYLRKNAEAEIRLSHLRKLMLNEGRDYHCPSLAAALLEFSELARRESSYQPLRNWLQLFNRQLQALGWPCGYPMKNSERLTKQWQQCVQRLASSSSVLGNISIVTALAKLQTFLKQSNIDLQFDDRLQISLVDIEEAQDLVFDHVWMLSVDDRNWPQPINPVPFLPYGLQQELGMPGSTNQQQLEGALTQLSTLRVQTSGEMMISHHALEEEIKIRPSALLDNIPFEATRDGDIAAANTPNNDGSTKLEIYQESLHIPLQPAEQVSGGTSLLSNQSNCPFRAFARNRLGATALEEFSYGLNPLLRGNALHKALENIGSKIADSQTLHSLSHSASEKLLQDSAAIAIAYLRQHNPETMTPAFSKLEQRRLSRLMQGFLLLEAQRAQFTIVSNEKSVSWQHSKLALNLRIDRIDRLQDGTLVLIDYKTGKQTNYKWFDERPDDMQLPLYQIAISAEDDQTVAATLIYQLNAENIGLISPMEVPNFGAAVKVTSQAKSFDGPWTQLQKYWNKTIYALVEEFESGLIAIAPTRGYTTCQYCDLGPLCRIAESDPSRSLAAEDEL